MKLGEHIYQLRTARGMSQEELAQQLEVSRQSVSKWENDSAVPELDKLVKLSQLFGLTLDELVSGAAPQPQPAAAPIPAVYPHRTLGWIFLICGLVTLILISFFGGILSGLLFSSPLLVPALICILAKHRVVLTCAWAEFILIGEFLLITTGTSVFTLRTAILLATRYADSFSAMLNPATVIISLLKCLLLILLYLGTLRSFRGLTLPRTRRNWILLGMGWVIFVVLFFPLFSGLDPLSLWTRILDHLIYWIKLCGFAVLLVLTRGMIRPGK